MGTTSTKANHKHSPSVTRTGTFFRAARSPGFFPAVARKAASDPVVQTKLSVSKPAEPLEKEADRTADTVMRLPAEHLQRAATDETLQRTPQDETLQRFGSGAPALAGGQSEIQRAATGGQALASGVRSFMEPRLGADLDDVRIHADESAHSLSNHLNAKAFTYRNHVFFGRDQFQPETTSGRRLLAHELTHTIQQGATAQRKEAAEAPEAPERRLPAELGRPPGREPLSQAVRAGPAPVATSGTPPDVQRLGMQDVLDYFADKAYNIPGYRMLTLILGFNPINMRSTPRTAANVLRALVELIPGGHVITQVLDNHGVTNRAAEWVERKIAQLGDIGAMVVGGLRRFIDALSWTDIFDLGGVWDRAKRIFTDPIGRLITFGTGVVGELLSMVRQAVLRPLAALAAGTRGYDLLKAVLGEDPITREPYPRTPETLLGGFMKLIGREDIWENLERGKAVPRAYGWFRGALAGLMKLVLSIPTRIMGTFRSLTFTDVLTVAGAFHKIGAAFLGIAGDFASWALSQVLGLLEILVSVVAPKVMPYIAKVRSAFTRIVKNPVGFVRNLVSAGRLGFRLFAGNIVNHLKNALIKWLVGPLAEAGAYIPRSFSLLEVVKLVMSVLGLTWQSIRMKLVKILPEPVLQGLENSVPILVTLVREGPAGAWQQIQSELTALKDQLIGRITQMIQNEVVQAAIKKLVLMLNPAGVVVQAIVAIWNTVSFFIERIHQIGAAVASFIDSISAIAAGQVVNAANRIEQTMARTLVLVIGFLAKFAGLGNIPAKLVGIVKSVRQPVDKALDKIVDWLARMLSKVVTKAKESAKKLFEWWKKKVPIKGGDEPHTLTFTGNRKAAKLVVKSEEPTEPVKFLTDAALEKKIDADVRKPPIDTATGHAKVITTLQDRLEKVDDNERAAASGPKAKRANADAVTLDGELDKLGIHIGKTLTAWKFTDENVKFLSTDAKGETEFIKEFKIKRGSFSDEQKEGIATEAKRLGQGAHLRTARRDGKDVADLSVAKGIARRHVVSAGDMRTHYMNFLDKKKVSAAKLLLEERGSIIGARTIVKPPVTVESIRNAAVRRYSNFFGYAKNLFLGDSRENSSIQELLDKGHPEMQIAEKLEEHVDRIKRGWALDGSFQPTRSRKSSQK
jgi:hypothetical protein